MKHAVVFLFTALTLAFTHQAAAAEYEDSLRHLAEGVTTEAVKAKKERLALVDFTDPGDDVTPLGKFLADELATRILLQGELQVVDQNLLRSTLKKLRITRVETSQAQTVTRAAKAVRADAFATGSYRETFDGVQVTVRVINPKTAQPVGSTEGLLPWEGPLMEWLVGPEPTPPNLNEPPAPANVPATGAPAQSPPN
jgi:TolB-like protein